MRSRNVGKLLIKGISHALPGSSGKNIPAPRVTSIQNYTQGYHGLIFRAAFPITTFRLRSEIEFSRSETGKTTKAMTSFLLYQTLF